MENDLIFAGTSPVIIDFNGSPDDIYAPVVTTSYDINIVSDTILDDLYTAGKDNIGVRITAYKPVYVDGEISRYDEQEYYSGYMTPNMYSQEISLNLDNVNISCIDTLAIMKYITIDNIFGEADTLSYAEIIGSILAYVFKYDCHLLVDGSVSYGSPYNGNNGVLDFRCNLANFWDESGNASTAYEVIEELLRPFCMRLCYNKNNEFILYNINNIENTVRFYTFDIYEDGDIVPSGEFQDLDMQTILDAELVSNNTSTPTLEIRNTYDSVTAVASTSIPTYSKMVTDIVDYNDRDLYQYGDLNVQRNKTKGYKKETRYIRPTRDRRIPVTVVERITDDKYYYIWNGVYGNPDYELGPWGTGSYMLWYMNMNKAYEYLTGDETNPMNQGSVLNFYGGADNPTATGKEQDEEKGVEIHKKITVYAPDNGTPPEFLEKTDLFWEYHGAAGTTVATMTKPDNTGDKWGYNITPASSNRIAYHQEYDNIMLSSVQDNVVDIDISQSFSRTGVDLPIDILHNNTADNKTWTAGGGVLASADSYYFPVFWDEKKVKVDSTYFKKYATGAGGSSCTPVWDDMRVDLYVVLSDDSILQFNGLEWVSISSDPPIRSFHLGKLMNNEDLYHTEHRYNLLRTYSTDSFVQNPKYALGDEDYVFYYDNNGGIVEEETNDGQRCQSIKSTGNVWIVNSSPGSLSIKLPYIDDPAAKVVVNIYNSTMLGMTGLESNDTSPYVEAEPFYYTQYGASEESTQDFGEKKVWPKFIPVNATHIKAEHLDVNINISVPESNLGQMFPESDIRYTLKSQKNYVEKYEMPDFKVNTRSSFVLSSQSYLLFNNELAEPGEFIINGQGGRPESFTVQAYYNWLTNIRRIFNKTLRSKTTGGYPDLSSSEMNDRRSLIRLPEFPDTDYLVVSNSWDVKSDRHTYTAVESDDLYVEYVESVQSDEVPRKARAERFNLPTATRNRVR